MATIPVSDIEFRKLRLFIEQRCGIAISESKRYLIETRLSSLVVSAGCSSFGEFHDKLVSEKTSPLIDQVVDAMTTNETLWFRDTAPWGILRETLLPYFCEELAAGRKRSIRIWSAATSTGQEPYSIAIAILEHLRTSPQPAKADAFQIVGTDLSPSALFVALSGRYDRLSIERGLPPELRDRYFKEGENAWALDPCVKQMVRFEKRNLMEPFESLGSFDLVFCRNVLIYFSADLKHDIVTRIAARLNPGAQLIVGASESLPDMQPTFTRKSISGNYFYETPKGAGR